MTLPLIPFVFHCISRTQLVSSPVQGLVVRMSILDTKGRRFEPQHQYVFSLGKRPFQYSLT